MFLLGKDPITEYNEMNWVAEEAYLRLFVGMAGEN